MIKLFSVNTKIIYNKEATTAKANSEETTTVHETKHKEIVHP